jgi:Tol biopolymer transport system component
MKRFHKGLPRTSAFVGLVAGALAAAAPAAAVTPVPGTPPPATQVTINNGPGDQTDPHVSGPLVSYTSITGADSQIRYFDFATLTDSGISNALPGGGTGLDQLSDVRGSTIVFSRATGNSGVVYAFDAAAGGPPVELDPLADSRRRGAAIGDGTVAWIDTSFSGGELFGYDRVTGSSQRLTNDAAQDRRPQVSPDGSVIVWEHCALPPGSACDIYQAVKSGGGWSVGPVASSAAEENNPDTNGSIVIYSAQRSSSVGRSDVYWTPVAGGPESQLELDAEQGNPAISGDLAVFEGVSASGTTDVVAYELGTNRVYQLTNTPAITDFLSDVSLSPSGQARVVWSALEQDENVYGLSFQLPSSTTREAQAQAPVNTDGSSTFNAKRGVVPLKFTLTEDGSPTCELPPATLRLSRTGGASSGPIDESVYSSPADEGSEFRIAYCQYHYNVKSSALGPGSYLAEVLIDGAAVGEGGFELK